MLGDLLSALEWQRFEPLIELLSLSPEHGVASMIFLSMLVLLNDLIRTALMVTGTRSVITHLSIIAMTLFPAFLCAAVLILGGIRYPGRGWINLGLVSVLFAVWYMGGALTHLARRDTEGVDVGFMTVGALITAPCGLVVALVT